MRRRYTAGPLAAAAVVALATTMLTTASAAAPQRDDQVTVTVDTQDVVQEDYLGIGVNVIPWSLMANTTERGYDEADWEVDVERIRTLRPKVARLWFQIDWMELEKGQYDFESPEIRTIYRYLDAFEEAGTEILFNFGWKVGGEVHDWFNYPGVRDPYESAPADLEAYGESASAVLRELIDERGYDNVRYLTFYNEPNGGWDFEGPADQKKYYADMARAVHDQLVADGLRDRVEIWGPEEVGAPDWTAYMARNAGDVFDAYSFHLYGEDYARLAGFIDERQATIGDAPLHLTEMGWADPGDSGWETGHANYIIGSANGGVRSNLIWQLNGVMPDDPAFNTNGSFNLWDSVVLGIEPTAAFYEAGALMRYIPEHSTVLRTTSSDEDVRATAFRSAEGGHTVLVETKGDEAKDVRVEFVGDRLEDAGFHRIAYTDADGEPEANALLPASSGTLRAKGTAEAGPAFTDTALPAAHGYAIYTQAAPALQVAVDPVQSAVSGGGSAALRARVVDGKGGVTWSVVGEGNGEIDTSGVFTAPDVDAERTVAIRATSTAEPSSYAVAQVVVTPG
ncbi:Glycosyl hydrolase catalytic core [Promicromonospora umidemergens]|uniref:Alpha-L-arabinofuranosidase n=1 Tax=Promicromonospora umidemergens TaxID=629679 RepID=A0ABP8XCU1_9MICO|nr:glycosyl hydrolase [Promicromonospora umidemergens]MCP2281769.1 Glycosyl hydrolase catalytic core [Promicromonospora umidemergens]